MAIIISDKIVKALENSDYVIGIYFPLKSFYIRQEVQL